MSLYHYRANSFDGLRSAHHSSFKVESWKKICGRKIENLASLAITQGDQRGIKYSSPATERLSQGGATHSHNKDTWDPLDFITHHIELLWEKANVSGYTADQIGKWDLMLWSKLSAKVPTIGCGQL